MVFVPIILNFQFLLFFKCVDKIKAKNGKKLKLLLIGLVSTRLGTLRELELDSVVTELEFGPRKKIDKIIEFGSTRLKKAQLKIELGKTRPGSITLRS